MRTRKTRSPAKTSPPQTAKPKSSNNDRIANIRRAAYRCFARSGYHATTVDHICENAAISKGAFYWHFESKQVVFLDIIYTWADEAELQMRTQFSPALTNPVDYTKITASLIREARRARAMMPVWLEFVAQGMHDNDIRLAVAQFHRRVRNVIVDLLSKATRKQFNAATIQALGGTILGAFIGLICQDLADPKEADFDLQARRFMEMFSLFIDNHPHSVSKLN